MFRWSFGPLFMSLPWSSFDSCQTEEVSSCDWSNLSCKTSRLQRQLSTSSLKKTWEVASTQQAAAPKNRASLRNCLRTAGLDVNAGVFQQWPLPKWANHHPDPDLCHDSFRHLAIMVEGPAPLVRAQDLCD